MLSTPRLGATHDEVCMNEKELIAAEGDKENVRRETENARSWRCDADLGYRDAASILVTSLATLSLVHRPVHLKAPSPCSTPPPARTVLAVSWNLAPHRYLIACLLLTPTSS